MADDIINSTSAADLRKLAEEKVAAQFPAADTFTGEPDAKRLLHELQVHQVELEMQNEELQRIITEKSDHEAHLRNIITQTPAGYFHIDPEGRFLDVNDAWLRMHGYDSREEVIGKLFSMVQVESGSYSALAHLAELQRGKAIPSGEFISRRKDGTYGYHIFSAHPVVRTGNIVGFEWFIIDISERKQAQQELLDKQQELEELNHSLEKKVEDRTIDLEQRVIERTRSLVNANDKLTSLNSELEQRRIEAEENQKKLQQLSSAVEHSPAIVVITDIHGRIEYVNPKFTEITGYLPEEAIGRNPRILKAGVQSDGFYREMWETIRDGREWRGNFCNKKKNGDVYWEHASISPITNDQGNITHFVAIKEDATEDRRIAGVLLAARDAAEAANRSKSEFLANMSHEIRTPLNAIIGFSALTLKSSLPPRQHDYIGKIHSAGELLLNIINDILDFSKIEARQLKMEQIPFRLNIMTDNATSIVQQKAIDKGLNLLVETSPDVAPCLVGDPHRLGQIIVNLLSNAVKFTERGEIKLSTTLLKQENDRVQLNFSVSDTGIGITAAQIDRLFHPFTQADGSTTRRFGGTGLGLSISKQLVELMSGEIWCESVPGEGSRFCFTAWFDNCNENELEECNYVCSSHCGQKAASFDFSGSRILLVEDNEINRQLALELLKETGAIVHVAGDGQEAVTMTTKGSTSYDLVLMDIQMPVMDGYEATRMIRSDSRFTSLPIIAMTAHAMQEEQQKIREAGMDAHITKPIEARTLLRMLGFFLGAQESSAHLRDILDDDSGIEPIIPDIKGLDVAEALSHLDEDRKLYLWVLSSFVENQSNTAKEIEEALNAGDAKLALRHAHTMKGLAGTIGAVELEKLLQTLEDALDQGASPANVKDALDLFAAGLDRLLTELKIHLPAAPEAEETGGHNDQ